MEETLSKYIFLILLSTIIWGGAYIAGKIALDAGYHTFFISAIRFYLAALMLLVTQRKNFAHTTRQTYHSGMILGIFLFFAFILQVAALQFTTVSKSSFIIAMYVVFVPFIFWLMYRRRPSILQFIAVFISLLGTRFLTGNIKSGINLGDLMSLGSGIFFATHIVFLGMYVKKHNPFMLTGLQSALAGIASTVLFLVFEPMPIFNLQGLLAICYLGIMSSGVAFTLQAIAQKHISPVTVTLVHSLEAVFATIFSIFLFKEKIYLSFIIGAILIFSAILLAEIKFKYPKNRNLSLPKT